MTIADAPYIREAELYGMPPYEEDEFPSFEIADELDSVDTNLCKAADILATAIEMAEVNRTCEEKLTDFLNALNELKDEIRTERNKIERRCYE